MLLKQRATYQKHSDSLLSQQFNLDQAKFAQENAKDTMTMVAAMKAASVELKAQQQEIDFNTIEDVFDDMSDMMAFNDEVQDLMAQTWEVPDGIDETDLWAELDNIPDQVEVQEQQPSYLINAASAAKSQIANPELHQQPQHQLDEAVMFPSVPRRMAA